MTTEPPADQGLSPTDRSTPRRERERAQTGRDTLYDVLDASLVCHLAVVVDGVPLALPTVFAVDVDGPDRGGTLYVHGSVASRSLVQAPGQDVSVTMTVLDGIVLARSGFNHSMNYRSAVVVGRPRLVTGEAERSHALDLLVDHVTPGRSARCAGRPARSSRPRRCWPCRCTRPRSSAAGVTRATRTSTSRPGACGPGWCRSACSRASRSPAADVDVADVPGARGGRGSPR